MTERTPKFDRDDLMSDDETSFATADLPGGFSAPCPRGHEIADHPPGAEVRYRSAGDEIHFVPSNEAMTERTPRFDRLDRLSGHEPGGLSAPCPRGHDHPPGAGVRYCSPDDELHFAPSNGAMPERTPRFDRLDRLSEHEPGGFSAPCPRGHDHPPEAEVRYRSRGDEIHFAPSNEAMTERTPRFDCEDLLPDKETSFASAGYRIPGVPLSSDGDEIHFVPANRSTRTRDPRPDDERYEVVCSLDTEPGGTVDLPPVFSPERTTISPQESVRLALVFDHFDHELMRLSHRWMTNAPVSRIAAMVRDLRSFMRILLDDVELEPVYTRSAETTLLVHDTYVRLISVAGILREGIDERWANIADLESAYAYAEATLDAFTPFVGLADRAMRRICLEGETLEAALRWLAHQLDEEAAERLRAAEAFVARATAKTN